MLSSSSSSSHVYFTVIFFLLVSMATQGHAQIEYPPIISQGPPSTVIYFAESIQATTLPCYARGVPSPRIQWLQNGKPIEGASGAEFQLDHIKGSGYYQCQAINKLGTAVSNVTTHVKAIQAAFRQGEDSKKLATLGDKLTLDCNYASVGVPTPLTSNYGWRTLASDGGNDILLNRRVQVDEHGSLHFAAITQNDFIGTRECRVSNRKLKIEAAGSPLTIVNSGSPSVPMSKPAIMFYSNKTRDNIGSTVVVGLEGEDVSLRCFFSGSDNILIKWERKDGIRLQHDHIEYDRSDSELRIKAVVKSDEAVYVCSGSNGAGVTEFETKLYVHSAPVFQSNNDRPHNVNKSVGDNLVFNCKAHADPPATIQWYKNGELINVEEAKKDANFQKFRWSDDLQTLTIEKLCKNNCTSNPQNKADIMVIQCNASNTYNYTFSNGYINVFEKTKLTKIPPTEIILAVGSTLTLSAHAVSDLSTPVTFVWTRDDKQLFDDKSRVHIVVGNDGVTNLTISDIEHDEFGTYKCRATNGISDDVSTTAVVPPEAVADLWPMILAIIVLLVIFLVFGCILAIGCFIHQNRGEDYPVYETEKKQGNNPEQDVEDAGFHPFQRKDTGSDAGSTISRSSLERLDKRIDEETGLIRERKGSAAGFFN